MVGPAGLNTPPGSMGLPLIGEALSYSRSPHRFVESREAEHGDVFKTRLLGDRVVCFVGPEAFTFFIDNPAFERAGAAPKQIRELLCQRSLPLVGGEQHRAMRGKVSQVFTPDSLQRYLDTLQPIVEEFAERWASLSRFGWVGEYKSLSASVCAAMLLGDRTAGGGYERLVPLLDSFLAGLSAIPINLPWTRYGRALGSRDRLLSLIDEAIARHRSGTCDDILSRLLAARGQDGSGLAEEELRAQMVHMFFAAYGGIFRVLSLMSMELGLHPDVRERVRKEVQTITPAGPITMAALSRMQYLDDVTREVRRHNRIFATTFLSTATADAEYGGYRVPKGWKVMGAIYATMQDPSVFTDPLRFDPERFSPGRAEDRKQPNSYVPHSGGSMDGHRCPAEDLATLVMKQAVAVLLRSYSWGLPPQDLSLDSQPSPLPSDGLRVIFERA
ncbi:MAG: cytochrome P450 [Chloroflexi bacterium]|nr:cytochrome P450 [Chloroflexota bacterium]